MPKFWFVAFIWVFWLFAYIFIYGICINICLNFCLHWKQPICCRRDLAAILEEEIIQPEQHFAMDVGKEEIIINVVAQNIISMLKWMKAHAHVAVSF